MGRMNTMLQEGRVTSSAMRTLFSKNDLSFFVKGKIHIKVRIINYRCINSTGWARLI